MLQEMKRIRESILREEQDITYQNPDATVTSQNGKQSSARQSLADYRGRWSKRNTLLKGLFEVKRQVWE